MDFYVAGRGGVLGDVPADVVDGGASCSSSRTLVRTAWERSAAVMSRRRAAEAMGRTCSTRGRASIFPRIATGPMRSPSSLAACHRRRAGRRRAAVRGLARAAGARRSRASSRCTSSTRLRELRGALHGAAVLTVGLLADRGDRGAHARRCSSVFGWPDVPGSTPSRCTSVGRWPRRAPTACSAATSPCSTRASEARSWSCWVRFRT